MPFALRRRIQLVRFAECRVGVAAPGLGSDVPARVRRFLGRTRVAMLVAVASLALGAFGGARIASHRGTTAESVQVVAANASSTSAVCAKGATLNIVAHQDDDLLFLSPDLLHDIRAGKCVRTIFLTAGDAGELAGKRADQRTRYWHAREAGSMAAYALMSGVRDSWKQSHILVRGHRIVMFTLSADPKISEIFMRLPDGNVDGGGFSVHHFESLLKLRDGEVSVIHAIDGSTSYTKAGLLATVIKLVQMLHPNVIRAQDYVTPDFALVRDHSDHTTTAELAHAASNAYHPPHTFVGYVDYNVDRMPPNLSGPDLALKQAAFYLYDRYDKLLPCYTPTLRATGPDKSGCAEYAVWLQREYRVSTGPGWYQPCLVPTLPSYEPSVDAIESQIRAQGCAVGTVTDEPSDTVPDGYTISLTPGPSPTFLPQGTKVNITESTGPEDTGQ